MEKDLNLNNLKYFYEVAKEKNITKASQNLFLSQPTLTKAIHDLEKQLNVQLFIRSKKGVVLTKEAEILYEQIEKVFNGLDKTINIINDYKKDGGYLYIGATTTNFLEVILPTLNQIKKKHSNINIDMTLEEIEVLSQKAKLDKLDIVIKNDYEQIDNFVLITSFEIEDKFVASKKHFSHLLDKKIKLEDLIKEPLVLLSNITHGRRNFDKFLKDKNLNITPTYEFNSYSLCKELIRNGFGIGIGNPIHYKSNDFIILSTDFNLPTRKFEIGYISTSRNPIIEEFKDFIVH